MTAAALPKSATLSSVRGPVAKDPLDTADWAREDQAMRRELGWYLTSVVPELLADVAVLLQDALDCISPASAISAGSLATLPIATDFGDSAGVHGQLTFHGYTIVESELAVKFPSRSMVKWRVDPLTVHSLMDTHHHTVAALTMLRSTLQPFHHHIIETLLHNLQRSIHAALSTAATPAPAASHAAPLSAPSMQVQQLADDLAVGLAVAPAGLVLTVFQLAPAGSLSSLHVSSSGSFIGTPTNKLTTALKQGIHHVRASSTGSAVTSAASPPPSARSVTPQPTRHAGATTVASSPSTGSVAALSPSRSAMKLSTSVRSMATVGAPSPGAGNERVSLMLGDRWFDVLSDMIVEVPWAAVGQMYSKLHQASALLARLSSHLMAFAGLAMAE
ncbi:hypothetical protein GGF31_005238 [Allomyces arbusculus]|nr:hypothetical protein GGF31_005238 [Allomyces arbusculus]